MNRRRFQAQHFTVGWISALPLELEAARTLLDEEYESNDDTVQYVLGRIGKHDVVMCCLPKGQIGTNAAAVAATRMQSIFPAIQIGLMVGIGGGVPSSGADVRLGDVVIGSPQRTFGGVVQYDFVKTGQGGSHTRTGFLNAPPPSLLTAVSMLQADPDANDRIEARLRSVNIPQKFKRCNTGPDNLYSALYDHTEGPTCDKCSKDMLVTRASRENERVVVHYGTIASGNQVMKDGVTRDKLSTELGGILCFEMEAAGLSNTLPCLVIRGICDYADSHKNKEWQPFAAVAAAACAREILVLTPPAYRPGFQTSHNGQLGSFSVPFSRDEHFVDRPSITDRLEETLEPDSSARAALVGIGGVGKSQIAIEYAYRLRARFPLVHIFWVHASDPERFRQSYRKIAEVLHLPGLEDPTTDVLSLVYRWLCLESNGPWLMILDNMDDATFAHFNHGDVAGLQHEFTVRKYLPQREGGTFLITSRDSNAALRLVGQSKRLLHVQAMSIGEAKTILDNKLENHLGSDEERRTLAVTLDCIPLALTQAAAYIDRRRRMTIARYLDLLERDREGEASLLRMEESDLRRNEDVPNSVLRTWQITFDQIRDYHQPAADLMSRMSLFDRKGIPEFLLQAIVAENDFEEAIEILLGYAIINSEIGGTNFEMHRLVQLATIVWLQHLGELKQHKELALTALAETYPTGNFENWTTCLILEPHARSLLHEDYCTERARRLRVKIQRNRAWYHSEQGNYNFAEQMAKQSLHDANELLGAEHVDTLTSMANLALTYSNQGRWKEAEELFVQVMETGKRVLGDEHPDTLTIMAHLASTYWNQGRWKEAEKLSVQVIETRKRMLGDKHPDTLSSMNNLAHTYKARGRKDEAVQLMETVVVLRQKIIGPEHPHTKESISTLALWVKS